MMPQEMGAAAYPSDSSARAPPVCSIDTEHNDMVNDIQLDYYGKRLVTCSSDRTFRVYDISPATSSSSSSASSDAAAKADPSGNASQNSSPVLEHVVRLTDDSNAPIHRIAWAHPKFGSLLAVGCQDGKVYIYREELNPHDNSRAEWVQKYVHNFHSQAVLSVAWAPYEYGLCLASASADGRVSFLARLREGWVVSSSFMNTEDGAACTSVSWAPYNSLGAQTQTGLVQRVVTGSMNHSIKVWRRLQQENHWTCMNEDFLNGHEDWVRDVAWAPNVGIPSNMVASCSDDQTVRVWMQDEASIKAGKWKSHIVNRFRCPVYRVQWSLTGSVLSVAAGDDHVTFWKALKEDQWVQLSDVNEYGATTMTAASS